MPTPRFIAAVECAVACVLLALLSVHSVPEAIASPACQAVLDLWCEADVQCSQSCADGHADLPLVARYISIATSPSPVPSWRCISPSSLDPTRTKYTSGDFFCGRGALGDVADICSRNSSSTPPFPPYPLPYNYTPGHGPTPTPHPPPPPAAWYQDAPLAACTHACSNRVSLWLLPVFWLAGECVC